MIIKGNMHYTMNLYFESAAIIIYFVKLGRYIDGISKDKTKDENKNSKIVCPYCQSTSIAEIMYGEPVFDDELEEALRNGEIYLGGCCYYPDSPEYHCNKCGKNFPESPHDPDWGVEFDTDDENEDD